MYWINVTYRDNPTMLAKTLGAIGCEVWRAFGPYAGHGAGLDDCLTALAARSDVLKATVVCE